MAGRWLALAATLMLSRLMAAAAGLVAAGISCSFFQSVMLTDWRRQRAKMQDADSDCEQMAPTLVKSTPDGFQAVVAGPICLSHACDHLDNNVYLQHAWRHLFHSRGIGHPVRRL